MSVEGGEYSLEVPVDLVKKTSGLSIDIGGSIAKFLYRSKDNLKEAEINTDGQTGHLQLVSFPRSKLSDALEYIKQHAQITRNGINDRPEIFATGFGCMELGKTINETLHIQIKNVTEFECVAKAFKHLASEFPRKEFLEPHDEAEARKQEEQMIEKLAVVAQFLGKTKEDVGVSSIDSPPPTVDDRMPSVGPLDKCEHIYPCLLAMLGSGTVYMQIDENKSFKILEMSQRGGISFHGVGALLTGVLDFDELMELASRGDEKNVSLYSDELFAKGSAAAGGVDDETIYEKCAAMKEPALVYSFQKATQSTRENFNPEDLAISWLNTSAWNISQTLLLWCKVTGVRRLFICGGFCNHALVRRCLTKELNTGTFLWHVQNHQQDGRIKFDFIKPELHLGTLGALIVQFETLSQETSKAKV